MKILESQFSNWLHLMCLFWFLYISVLTLSCTLNYYLKCELCDIVGVQQFFDGVLIFRLVMLICGSFVNWYFFFLVVPQKTAEGICNWRAQNYRQWYFIDGQNFWLWYCCWRSTKSNKFCLHWGILLIESCWLSSLIVSCQYWQYILKYLHFFPYLLLGT